MDRDECNNTLGRADMINPATLGHPTVERRVVRVRRHWAALLEVMLRTVGIVVVAFSLSRLVAGVANLWLVQSLLWYIAILAVLHLAWKMLEWWVEVIIVTDKRLLITSGVVQVKNSILPSTKVIDISLLRPKLGMLLGYGTLRVVSAGQNQNFDWIPRPEEVFRAISEGFPFRLAPGSDWRPPPASLIGQQQPETDKTPWNAESPGYPVYYSEDECQRHATARCRRHCLICRQPACHNCIDCEYKGWPDGQCIDCLRVADYTGNRRGENIPLRAGVIPPAKYARCPVCRGHGGTKGSPGRTVHLGPGNSVTVPGVPASRCPPCGGSGRVATAVDEPYYPGLPAMVYDTAGRKFIRLMCVACNGLGEQTIAQNKMRYPATATQRQIPGSVIIPCDATGCYGRGFYDRPAT